MTILILFVLCLLFIMRLCELRRRIFIVYKNTGDRLSAKFADFVDVFTQKGT